MKFTNLRKHFMKWAIYNAATFAFLSVWYVPYQLFFIQLSGIQFWKWFLTTGFLGSAVNILMRPYVSWITHFLDRRYGKKIPEEHVEWEEVISEDGMVWWTEKEKK